MQSQEVACGGLCVRIGSAARVAAGGAGTLIEVTWRNGKQSVVAECEAQPDLRD